MTDINKIKPLCLSFRTPPAVRPQSILIGKMIPEWINQGLKPVIMTYQDNGKWQIDLPIYQIEKLGINRYFNKIPFLKNFLEKKYYEKLFSLAKGIINKHQINIVYSFSNPYASNILGAMIKEKLGIKFISNFSDPWYDSPYQSFSPAEAKRVLNQERCIIRNSDRVVFNNDVAKKLVMKKYPIEWQDKALVIPHCYDRKDYPEVVRVRGNEFIFSHIGVFYPQRNPQFLLEAFKKLLEQKPELSEKTKINFIGGAGNYTGYKIEDIKKLVADYNLAGVVEILPIVDYQESLRFMKLADCLIVIDADMVGSPFFPSKVVDYAGSGSLILGITPTNSPTAEFLKNLGFQSFNYQQLDELVNYLKNLVTGEVRLIINNEFLNQFDVKNTTAKLIRQFQEVLDLPR